MAAKWIKSSASSGSSFAIRTTWRKYSFLLRLFLVRLAMAIRMATTALSPIPLWMMREVAMGRLFILRVVMPAPGQIGAGGFQWFQL